LARNLLRVQVESISETHPIAETKKLLEQEARSTDKDQ
jgi:hypothetical protein